MPGIAFLKPLVHAPSGEDIAQTAAALAPYVRRTPVLRAGSLDRELGCQIFFKAENLQRVGAFKMRGALRAAMALTPEQRAKGLATHSSGNHAQAVAKAALLLGCPATIVMPENAPVIKRDAVAGYGARIVSCAPTLAAREAGLQQVVESTGASFIPPYDHFDVIAGQATAAWEFLHQCPDLDALIVPIGGGGLAAGSVLAAASLARGMPVYAAEPERVDDAFRSLRSGTRQGNERTDTVADGLRTALGSRNFAILQAGLADVLTVPEKAILPAMWHLMQRLNAVVEPSAAVPFAALQARQDAFRNKRIGIILSGGNTDFPPKG